MRLFLYLYSYNNIHHELEQPQCKELIKELEADGWFLHRIKDSHHIFKYPIKVSAVPVAKPKKDLPIGMIKSIRKQAGL